MIWIKQLEYKQFFHAVKSVMVYSSNPETLPTNKTLSKLFEEKEGNTRPE
jgi:hypothetical protein